MVKRLRRSAAVRRDLVLRGLTLVCWVVFYTVGWQVYAGADVPVWAWLLSAASVIGFIALIPRLRASAAYLDDDRELDDIM